MLCVSQHEDNYDWNCANGDRSVSPESCTTDRYNLLQMKTEYTVRHGNCDLLADGILSEPSFHELVLERLIYSQPAE